jgi:hypothetical protein
VDHVLVGKLRRSASVFGKQMKEQHEKPERGKSAAFQAGALGRDAGRSS